jgi:predicted RNase H-like nuclease (RuvC/YqgF family)
MYLTKKDLEDLVKKYQADSKLSKLNDMSSTIDDMRRMLAATTEENEKLKKHLLARDTEISELAANLTTWSNIIGHGASG